MPHDQTGDPRDRRSAEDAAWQAIIDHYGERPTLDDEAVAPAAADDQASAPSPEPEPILDAPARADEEHYVPPAPPPVPRAAPARLVAWLGLFGTPVVLLVALVLHLSLPSLVGLILIGWFVGGFVYLVASMRPDPRDEDDDGAVV